MPQENHYKNAILENNFEWFYYHTPPEDLSLHEHDFHEIYLFLSGNIHFRTDGREFRLSPGDIVIVPSGILHTPVFFSKEPYERIVLWVRKEYITSISTAQTDLTRCFLSGGCRIISGGTERLRLFHRQLMDGDGNRYGGDIRILIAVWELLLYMNLSAAQVPSLPHKEKNRYQELTEYIRTHIHENLSLELLAAKCSLSKYHLLRDFKQNYGLTLHQYIIKERLVEAKRMLLEEIPVTTVCIECGFSEYSGFLAAFKREYHITPTAFCRLMKQQSEEMTCETFTHP